MCQLLKQRSTVLEFYVFHFGVELDAAIKSCHHGAAQTDLRSNTKSEMSPIENLTLTCDKDGPFSEGDTVQAQCILF